jgi:hypothetical protein
VPIKLAALEAMKTKTMDHQEELIFDNSDVTEEMEFERVHKDRPCSFCRGRLRFADCVAARVFEYTETASSKE